MVKIPGTDLPAAASGLRLHSKDLLKFRLLYNNHWIWKDKQVVPEKWLEESFQAHVQRPGGATDGWFIWLPILASARHDKKQTHFYCCLCRQWRSRIFFDKTRDLIAILFFLHFSHIFTIPFYYLQ